MREQNLLSARILVFGESGTVQHLLERAGYSNLAATADPLSMTGLFAAYPPDLVVLDLHSSLSEDVLLMVLEQTPKGVFLPVLVVAPDDSAEMRREALAAGARDVVGRPFDLGELLLRVRSLLETRLLHLGLQSEKQVLEERVDDRQYELDVARLEMIERLAVAAEYRDDDTGEHLGRVGRNAALIAEAMGLAPDQAELLRRAAPLHDVGKIGIPDGILLKPGKLTAEEFERVKIHTTIGATILAGGRSEMIRMAELIAHTHHERWDGSGYHGLERAEIPLVSRIVTVADVFDALTHKRPYKRAWPVPDAVLEIISQSGKQFDPEVVDTFLQVIETEESFWVGADAGRGSALK